MKKTIHRGPASPSPRHAAGLASPSPRHAAGFTLIEMMVVVAIIGILSAVAYPSYTDYVVRTRRASAAGCLMEQAQFMERVYASNLRYDQNGGVATALPATVCRTELASHYLIQLAAGQPQQRTFTLEAVPQGRQAAKDTRCATLTIDQANVKGENGSGTIAECWK